MAKAYTKKKNVAKPLSAEVADTTVETKVVDPKETERLEKLSNLADLQTKAMRMFQSASDARKKFDWEWLTRDLFRRGYMFSRYNSQSKTVILNNKSKSMIPINLVNTQLRIVRNQVTSFRPKWEVLPRSSSKESIVNARYSQRLLDYYYDKLNIRSKCKKVVTQGLTYSVGGPFEIGFDPDADNGNGEVYLWNLDTYDFYVDPLAQTLEEAEFCFKAVRTSIDKIKANPSYTFVEDVHLGNSQLAASEYKQFLIQALSPMTGARSEHEEGEILKVLYLKVRITEGNKEGIKKELEESGEDSGDLFLGEVLIRKVTYLDRLYVPLRVELLRRSDFPFVLYLADVEPTSLYGEGWMKHLIPANRVVNALESSIFDYNYKYAKGRLAVPKNSGVRIVTNNHGDIIEYNPGATPPTAINLASLPNSYQVQIDNMRRYIEDMGGAHDVSVGRIPTGIRSGVGIAELKAADATNSADLVDSMEEFLIEVGQKILREIAKNYDIPRVIKALGKGGNPEHFAVIGEKGSKGRKDKKQVKIGSDIFNLAVIGDDAEIRVTIGSWLAYTKSAQFDKLKDLFDSGVIDQKTFLEHAEFNDVDSIIESTRKSELLSKFRGTPAQETGPTDEEIAEQENFQMLQEGKTPEALPEDNHYVHLIVHQEAIGQLGNPILEAHMTQHEKFIRDGIGKQVNQYAGKPQQAVAPSAPMPEEEMLMQALQGAGMPQQEGQVSTGAIQ